MKKLLIFMFALASCASTAMAARHYFEPTAAESKEHEYAIGDQQAAYSKASTEYKASGYSCESCYRKACANALYHFQLAWMDLRKAQHLIQIEEFAAARKMLDSATQHCNGEEKNDRDRRGEANGPHRQEQISCLLEIQSANHSLPKKFRHRLGKVLLEP